MHSLNTTTENSLLQLFELTPDLVIIADKEGFFKNVNDAVVTKLGYTREELFARPISSFIHPDDREKTKKRRKELLNGKALINFDNRYITKGGQTIWLHWTSIYMPEKENVFAIAKDITDRKQLQIETEEKYIKFKSLATHFKQDNEKSKKFLAIELHEELAQLATVIKTDVDWLKDHVAEKDTTVMNRLKSTADTTQLLINSIRRLSYAISPGMIDDVGLNETLEWLCQDFETENGIWCQFESGVNDDAVRDEIKLDLFRICQEALNHILQHATASNVWISLEKKGNKIKLCIKDDGKQFSIDELNAAPCLIAIRERVASVDGEFIAEPLIGNGTKICVTI